VHARIRMCNYSTHAFTQLWKFHSFVETSTKTDHVFIIANDEAVIDILKIAFDLV